MNRVTPKLIAIVGGSGSGKTWLAKRLQAILGGQTQRISLDAFYLDRSHLTPNRRAAINYDHPRCIDWPLVLRVFQQWRLGRTVRVPVYDFASHSRTDETTVLSPGGAVIVEGLWLLRRPALRRMFDLSIFLDCSARCRLKWRVSRDTLERGRTAHSVRKQFCATVAPMHERYVATQCRHADLVVRQPLDTEGAGRLFDTVWDLMAADAIFPESKRALLRERAKALMTKGEVV